jgi:hypothetical protein
VPLKLGDLAYDRSDGTGRGRNNTTSPSLSIAILSKATQAVSPGPPVVDTRAPVRWIVGHGKHSVWVYADEMRGLESAIDEKPADDLLAQTIGIGHALVRTQVLQPRVRQECFDETAILSRVLKKSPVVSAIAVSNSGLIRKCTAHVRLRETHAVQALSADKNIETWRTKSSGY